MSTITTRTIGRFTIEVKAGQFTPPDWPAQAKSVYPYAVTITPGRQSFTGRTGQKCYIKSEAFYLNDLDSAMAQYREYVRFAMREPFVLQDEQLNPQYV